MLEDILQALGWASYQKTGTVCGIELPDGLQESQKLPEPIFTPTTKAQEGHDENVSFEEVCNLIGVDLANEVKNKTIEMGYNLDIYTFHKLGLSILGNVDIISDDYLDYIIDEYFESRIKYDKTKFIKSLFFSDKDTKFLYKTKEYFKLKRTISTFIRLAKSNNMSLEDIYKIYKKVFFNC